MCLNHGIVLGTKKTKVFFSITLRTNQSTFTLGFNSSIFEILLFIVVITVNYCKCMLLLYSPLNSYLYVHWILDFKSILLLITICSFKQQFFKGKFYSGICISVYRV